MKISYEEMSKNIDFFKHSLGVEFDVVRIYETEEEISIELNINKKYDHPRNKAKITGSGEPIVKIDSGEVE